MTDDPGGLFKPLTDYLVGGFLSIALMTVPVFLVFTTRAPISNSTNVHNLQQT